MSNKNNETKTPKAPDTAVTPNTGADEALKAENEALKAELEALKAQAEKAAAAKAKLEALKAQAEKAAAAKAKLEAPNVPDNERVEIYVPKGNANDEHNLLISVNGVNYLLPRGKKSLVPSWVAAELHRAAQAQERLDRRIDAMTMDS